MSSLHQFRRSQTDHTTTASSPLRQNSNASTNSSAYSGYSNPFVPSRTSTISSTASSAYSQGSDGRKTVPESVAMSPSKTARSYFENLERSPDQTSKSTRRSLRPLPQPPNAAPPRTQNHDLPFHTRSQTMDSLQVHTSDQSNPPTSLSEARDEDAPLFIRPHIHHAYSNPHTSVLTKPDLATLQKSSTGHLRNLSKLAQNGENEELMTAPVPSVVGLQGRRQLKRTDSTRGKRGNVALANGSGYAWGERNWMDKQRQFLQAYEYLCHIGEAKEWIEDIIHKPIPPIVQLEEALRDGVTLAEIVQALFPERPLRIFRHPKLQFRHSDNIATFFRFLEEVELPELFRFELIDLYEKKNIPKVIYCIHALSWLLYRRGIVDFRIGNLVGQLEFEHHELEQMQKGLDKAGINMPSFSGMGASFGAEPEPEPEPVESEEDRIERELHESEDGVAEFQAQVRGALIRLRLGDKMTGLWDSEERLIDLQSRIRGDWARQIIQYRLTMRRFAVHLQSVARGFLSRSRQQSQEQFWRAKETDVLKIQSIVRAHKARAQVNNVKMLARQHTSGVKSFQAAIRGVLARRRADEQYEASKDAESEVQKLQAAIHGMLARQGVEELKATLRLEARAIVHLQASARGVAARSNMHHQQKTLVANAPIWRALQAVARGKEKRDLAQHLQQSLKAEDSNIELLQAHSRGAETRERFRHLKRWLSDSDGQIIRLQSSIGGFLLRRQHRTDQQVLQSHVHIVSTLQALSRGAIVRKRIGSELAQLEAIEPEIVELQSLSRAMTFRLRIGETLNELEEVEDVVVELQALARASIARSVFAEKQRFFKENMQKVVKVQSVIRAKIQGEAYKSLTNGKNPPVGTLKGFVHLLNDSDFDFDEEIEFERLRKTVVQHVRQNEMADQYITQLDIKIALLVKNKITLDEVVKHQRHFGGHVGSLLPNSDISSKDPFDLKALNKTSRRKLEHYQELFFLLQTQPQYLSRLFKRLREVNTAEKECERIKHLMMGLFGYAQKRREEYYLIKLLVRSAKEEVDASNSIQDYMRCSSFWNKLFGAYIKSPRDRKFLRDVLAPVVRENVVENVELDLESDPMQIYLSAINNEELRTGQRSHRRRDVAREEAIRDPETRATFIRHMQDLRDVVDVFFAALEDLLHKMPFGVRFIAQQTYDALLARFPEEDPIYLLQIAGQWVWKYYLQPALTEPDKYGVVDRSLTQEQKRNLGEVAKVLGQVAAGRLFGNENVYLQPLNSHIGESIQRLGEIWHNLIAVPPAEEHFDIDEFNDLYAKTKPTLYIKMSDIFSIHQLLTNEIANTCPSQDDFLRDIIRELGSVKSNESELMGVGSTEICLTLNPKLHNAEDPDAEMKALFTETKRCVLYIIRVQAGTTLMDIMVKPITAEDEDRWDALVRDELHSNGRRKGAYSEANTLIDIGALSYADLKRTALENILQLEHWGRLTRNNQYQDLLNAIAVDIRTKHRRRIQRQRELEGVRTTLARLNDQALYLEQQLKTYNDYIEQAMVTLQNKKGKKRFLMPFTKQWDHERELQRSGRHFKFGSFKYSARTLADKGVLVHWKGYTERQWDRVDLTVSSNEIGVFMIDGSSGNMMVPGANAQVPLDDLLQAQFNNTQFMDFFEGSLRVNVNLFLHLIMKKFYNE